MGVISNVKFIFVGLMHSHIVISNWLTSLTACLRLKFDTERIALSFWIKWVASNMRSLSNSLKEKNKIFMDLGLITREEVNFLRPLGKMKWPT